MSNKKPRIPSYRHQKSRNLAVVRIDGHDEYLGEYGSEKSKAEYNRLVSEWLKRKNLPGLEPEPETSEITIVELIAKYLPYVEGYYKKSDGSPASEIWSVKIALRPVAELFGNTRVIHFGPKALKKARDEMIRKGWTRKSINKQINRVKALFKWGGEEEIVPASVYHSLLVVKGLKKGKSEAVESDPIQPVPLEHVESIKKFVSEQVWGMIQLQLLTGMRPGELVILRGCDMKTEEGALIWTYTPEYHKTQHHEKSRKIHLGPKAQEMLKPFLKIDLQARLFNYKVASYRRAIFRACVKANAWAKGGKIVENDAVLVPRWHPNQLRHNVGTILRSR